MKTLTKYINNIYLTEQMDNIDNQIINEKLECTVLKDVAKQLLVQKNNQNKDIEKAKSEYGDDYLYYCDKSNNKIFKEIFADYWTGMWVEWSKITDKQVTVYEPKDIDKKVEKLAKDIINQKQSGLIIIQNPDTNVFKYVIFASGNSSVIRLSSSAGQSVNHRNRRKWKDLTKTEKLQLLTGNRIYYIDLTGKVDQYMNIRRERSAKKEGMIPLDPELIKRIAVDNVNRYKKIIAQYKTSQENNDALLDKCQDIIQKISELTISIAKNPSLYADIIYPSSILTSYIYNNDGRYKGLLPLITNYISARNNVYKYSYAAERYRNDMQETKKEIEDRLQKIDSCASKYNITL